MKPVQIAPFYKMQYNANDSCFVVFISNGDYLFTIHFPPQIGFKWCVRNFVYSIICHVLLSYSYILWFGFTLNLPLFTGCILPTLIKYLRSMVVVGKMQRFHFKKSPTLNVDLCVPLRMHRNSHLFSTFHVLFYFSSIEFDTDVAIKAYIKKKFIKEMDFVHFGLWTVFLSFNFLISF